PPVPSCRLSISATASEKSRMWFRLVENGLKSTRPGPFAPLLTQMQEGFPASSQVGTLAELCVLGSPYLPARLRMNCSPVGGLGMLYSCRRIAIARTSPTGPENHTLNGVSMDRRVTRSSILLRNGGVENWLTLSL